MKYIFSPEYEKTDIGNHIFPLKKYRYIKDKLIAYNNATQDDFIEPHEAPHEDILLVHTKVYLNKLIHGTLSASEEIEMEIPYSKQLVKASLVCVEGTIDAAHIAFEQHVGIHLGGGFHHAYPDHGEGFCVLNDVAVAIGKLLKEKKVKKVLVIDCDLHQGNGTAFIFRNNPDIFTFSIHQELLYPYPKEKSSLDIGLPNGTGDRQYAVLLTGALKEIDAQFKPDIVFYVAGSDPFKDDQLSSLNLSIAGLKKRDEIVFEYIKKIQVPLVIVLAGGYSRDINDTVTIHYNTCIGPQNRD